MSWTYSGDPTASQKDAVRFWSQDTDTNRRLLSDEEINYLIAQIDPVWGNDIATAAVACDVIVAKFVGEPDISADGVSVSWSSVIANYRALAQGLRDDFDRIVGAGAIPLGFGYELIGVVSPGVAPPSFGKGFTDNPRAGSQEYGDRNHVPEYGWPDSGYWTGP